MVIKNQKQFQFMMKSVPNKTPDRVSVDGKKLGL